MPGVRTQVERDWARAVFWMYCIELEEETGWTAEALIARLGELWIGTRPFFLGLHEQPVLKERGLVDDSVSYPVTERAARQGLYLPSGLALTESQVNEVIEAVRDILTH